MAERSSEQAVVPPGYGRRRWPRRVLTGLGVFLLTLVVLVAAVLVYVQTPAGNERIRTLALGAGNKALLGKVDAQKLVFRGRHLLLSGVTLRDPEGELVARIAEVEVRVGLLPLLHKTVDITSLDVRTPELFLVSDEDGLNLMRAVAPRHPSPKQPDTGPSSLTFSLERLGLENGAVSFRQFADGAVQRDLRLHALRLDGSGRYGGTAEVVAGHLTGRAVLTRPVGGSVSLAVDASGAGDRLDAKVDLGAAGLVLLAQAHLGGKDQLDVTLEKLEVPPGFARGFLPSWPVQVPVSLRAEAHKRGPRVRATAAGQAGSARLALDADADVAAPRADRLHLALRHVNLAQMMFGGTASDLALTLDGAGGGKSLEAATGEVHLQVPESRVRGTAVGPVELRATANRGTFRLDPFRAVVPGLRVTGAGQGTVQDVHAQIQLVATDLSALARTFGGLGNTTMPAMAGTGQLAVALNGPLRHPGVSMEGAFPYVRVQQNGLRGLTISANIPDVQRPLDANAALKVARLTLGDRSLDDLRLHLLTKGRALELDFATEGFTRAALHLGGTVDEDQQGLLLVALTLQYPEAQWALQAPAHVHFGGGVLDTQRIHLAAGSQELLLEGSKRGEAVDASVGVHRLDLRKLPRAFVPESLGLAGEVTLDARAKGRLPSPAVDATFNVQDVSAKHVQHLTADGEGHYQKTRASGRLRARALGAQVDAEFELPVLALQKRRHEPLSAKVEIPTFDLARTLCAAAEAQLAPRACPDGTPAATGSARLHLQLAGFADAPVIHLLAALDEVRARQLPPTSLQLTVDGTEAEKLTAALKGTALNGSLEVAVSVDETPGALLARKHTAAAFQMLPFTAKVQVDRIALAALAQAGLISPGTSGLFSLQADAHGTAQDPRLHATARLNGLAKAPMQPTDVALALSADDSITVRLEVTNAKGKLAELKVDVGAPIRRLRTLEALASVPFRLDGKAGPVELADFPLTTAGIASTAGPGTSRGSRKLRGAVALQAEGSGSLAAPVLHLRTQLDKLAAGDTPLGHGEVRYDYASTRNDVAADLVSVNGGKAGVMARVGLDLSLPAVQAGLAPNKAPLDATLSAQNFDLAFLSGFSPILRKVGGLLKADGHATGTLGDPTARGDLEWTNGSLSLAGYGDYDRIHLLTDASNDHIRLEDLVVHSSNGKLQFQAQANREGAQWALTGSGSTDNFPITTEDQLVALISLRTTLSGTAAAGRIDIPKMSIPEAHIELPDVKRKSLQDLRRPPDIVLTHNGVPLDKKRAKAAAAKLPKLKQVSTAAGEVVESASPSESPPTHIQLVVDAPRNLWVKGQDINLEFGLSNDFKVDVAEETNIFGEVRILRGRADVLGRRFDMQRNSVVRFTGPPAEPALNVTAVYNNEKEQVKVFLHVEGQGTEIQLKPTSEPALTESEIYTLLATGHTSLSRGGGQSTIGSGQAVSVLGSLAASQLKQAVSDKVALDVLSIESGDQGLQGSKLEAGKYVSDSLYVGYTGRIGADATKYENSNAVRLEYQFTPRWSLQAEYGDAKSGSADVVWTRDY